ncbi:MAG TPA: FlgD immunoglobulin-like domain containing protein [Candidatus Limnocylindria bacterium]|nr:FlgD immunoglobulin-like domain containing protein [Candidatus Limnocylindria bacterium]
MKTGTNTSTAALDVQITSPTSNSVLSDEVTVSIVSTTALAFSDVKLYVDGQEMLMADDGTNFVINTPEWANGSHTLFATAVAYSKRPGVSSDGSAMTQRMVVSPYIPVTFDNYVSQLYFSEPFFEPDLGQTQHVTAVFAQYSDWTLQILNDASNVVRTVTNSGYAMAFDWDGKGDGGTNLPNGIYEYLVTATQATAPSPGPGGGGGTNAPPPGFNDAMMQTAEGDTVGWYPTSPTQALAAGWDSYFLLPPPMPPVKIDGDWHTWKSVYGPITPIQVPLSPKFQQLLKSQSMFMSTETSSAIAAAGAGAAKGPKKPPTKPVKGSVGTFGVGYQAYWGSPITVAVPPNGLPAPLNKITLESSTANRSLPLLGITAADEAENFAAKMANAGWKKQFLYDAYEFSAQKVRKTSLGGSNVFGQANIGCVISHAFYGSSVDYTSQAQQTYQTYAPFINYNANATVSSVDWLRFSEISFGSTNLRWVGWIGCNLLRDQNYQSMYNQQVLPINPNLHLFLSAKTILYLDGKLAANWAAYMTKGAGFGPETIRRSWFLAGAYTFGNGQGIPSGTTIIYRVAGWPNCMNDKLLLYAAPGTSDPSEITYVDHQTFPVLQQPPP